MYVDIFVYLMIESIFNFSMNFWFWKPERASRMILLLLNQSLDLSHFWLWYLPCNLIGLVIFAILTSLTVVIVDYQSNE